MTLALVAAVAGAIAYGSGSVLQAVGARRATEAGHGVLGVARQLPYVAGLGCDLAGWLLSLVALRRLPLFAVQSILAGSLAVTVVIAAATIGSSLRRTDAWLVATTVLALAVLGAASGAERARSASTAFEAVVLAAVPVIGVATAATARWSTPVATGAASGAAFGMAAVAARALHTTGSLVTEPLAFAVVAFGAVGLLGYAHALEHGDVATTTAALWVTEIVVPGLIGVVALGDHVRRGWPVPALLAMAVAIACAVALSTSAARATGVARDPLPAPQPPP